MNRKALKKIGIDGRLARQVMARHPQNAADAERIADDLRAKAARPTAKPTGGGRDETCDDCGLTFDGELNDDACPDCNA